MKRRIATFLRKLAEKIDGGAVIPQTLSEITRSTYRLQPIKAAMTIGAEVYKTFQEDEKRAMVNYEQELIRKLAHQMYVHEVVDIECFKQFNHYIAVATVYVAKE